MESSTNRSKYFSGNAIVPVKFRIILLLEQIQLKIGPYPVYMSARNLLISMYSQTCICGHLY